MKRTNILIFIAIFTFVLARPALGAERIILDSGVQPILQPTVDLRVTQLENYLNEHESPLAPYASAFVKAADTYKIPDWKLVPAITGVESTFGKQIPANSYNAYGWANGNYSFSNWEESIMTVTKTLKEKYIDHGLTTVESIAHVYAPPSTTWAGKVHFFMNQIDLTSIKQAKYLTFTL